MKIRTGYARTDDGVRLWYRLFTPADLQADANTLVLSNGASCTIQYWPPLVAHFSHRMPILEWDYRGHGRSQREIDPSTVTVAHFAKDLGVVLEAAEVERAVLCGHSLGVQVVLEAAHRFPKRSSAVIALFGTYGDAHRAIADWEPIRAVADRALARLGRALKRSKRWVRPVWESRLGLEVAIALGANRALVPQRYVERLVTHAASMDPEVALNAFRAALRYSARAHLPALRMPLLVFAGGRDRMTPAREAARMCALAPDAELCLLPDASHLGLIEQPHLVHRRIETFLERRGLLPAHSRPTKPSPPRPRPSPPSARALEPGVHDSAALGVSPLRAL